jgi:hypothetical protein
MSDVKRFRADHRHVVETEFDDAQFVRCADYDAAQSELAALREELANLRETNRLFAIAHEDSRHHVIKIESSLTAAEQRNAILVKAATEFMEYAESGWDHFPDVGVSLRAALAQPTESGASE